MRIVHTSDWHAGRVWKGIDRLPELSDVLENLGDFLERERIDVLIMSGDVFDSGAPNPAAERLVFGFLKRIGRAGVTSVVIAGNHDSPARLEAWGTLADLVGVRAVAYPRRLDQGGLVEIDLPSGERGVVAGVPFAAPRRLVSALELSADATAVKQKYDEGMRQLMAHLAAGFDAETVNLLMAHTHLQGAAFSGSEREVHLGEEWATTPQALPSTAHYIALGHIHKPQRMSSAPAPAYYAGSPIQLDFGEVGEEKSFVLIDARPRQPARIERIPYQGGIPLRSVRKSLSELERDASRMAHAGWLRIRIPMETPDPDVNGKVRRMIPNVVAVEVELPEQKEDHAMARPPRGSAPRELYRAYSVAHRGAEPAPAVEEAFQRLLTEVEQEDRG